MQADLSHPLLEILQKQFHFTQFRPGQLEALTTLLNQNRLLCIQPTGHGKSLLYQLPAVFLDGITLVISPLLALMRDQLMQLKTRFDISAASINSDQSNAENHAARKAAETGQIRILFIAPEQLDHVEKFDFLLRLPIRLLVVDEAHCISTWGHDFRPAYRQIVKLAHALVAKNPDVKLLALTATANEKTETDIKQQFTVDQQALQVHRENMDRPNIRLSVITTKGIVNKLITVEQILANLSGVGLIYCATRENTELVAGYLSWRGIEITAYHAGFAPDEKRRIQQDFIRDKYKVISATNALGMGIDKSNLRFIIHFDFPGSMTAYYQEVGRGGRDGLAAEGILLYDPVDSKIQQHFIDTAQPTYADFQSVLNTVAAASTLPNLSALKRETGMHPTKLTVIVAELVEQKFLKKVSQNGLQVYQSLHKTGNPDLNRYTTQFAARNAELSAMQDYAEQSQRCFMLILRQALGDRQADACRHCSVCTPIPWKITYDPEMINTVSAWVNLRMTPVTLYKKIANTGLGIAVLDGKLRSHTFIHFMSERTNSNQGSLGISNELMELIQTALKNLAKQYYPLSCLIPVPSRTWAARDAVIALLAKQLNIPALTHALYWHQQPSARQGKLLNNDQRQHNVANRMRVNVDKKIPAGAILLVDDYTGSGATLNEAARALRQQKQITHQIVPFTIAAIKWRLGSKGMI